MDRNLTLQFVRQLYDTSVARYGRDHDETILLFKYIQAAEPDPADLRKEVAA